MRGLLNNIHMLDNSSIDQVRILTEVCDPDWKPFLQYVVDTFDKIQSFPTPDMINEKFSYDLNADDKVGDPEAHLSTLLYDAHDRGMRRGLLELASKPDIKTEDLQELGAKYTSAIEEPLQLDMSIEKIYTEIKNRPKGSQFFVGTIDDETQGVSYGKVCTIFGFVSHFKTMMLMNVLYGNAYKNGYNAAIISLEGQKEETYTNLLSRHSYTLRPEKPLEAKKIQKADLNDEDQEFLYEVEKSFKSMEGNIYILDGHDISKDGVISEASIRNALDQCNENESLDIVALDYIQLCRDFKFPGARDVSERWNSATIMFSNLAIHYNKPKGLMVYLLSQANREGWLRAVKYNGQYSLNALAEINSLERASYYVVSVFTNETLLASGELSMQLLKFRGGAKIETPFTTFVDPTCGLIGDMGESQQEFSEALLDGDMDEIFSF